MVTNSPFPIPSETPRRAWTLISPMKINSILIANRGEIAIRIIRTARDMGITSYVIKTAKEPNAWYLEEADEIIDFSDDFDENLPEFLE